jgi:hypothetical protein
LADELASGLDSTPSCNELSIDDRGTSTRELANEAFVGDNAAVQVDFCQEAELEKEKCPTGETGECQSYGNRPGQLRRRQAWQCSRHV